MDGAHVADRRHERPRQAPEPPFHLDLALDHLGDPRQEAVPRRAQLGVGLAPLEASLAPVGESQEAGREHGDGQAGNAVCDRRHDVNRVRGGHRHLPLATQDLGPGRDVVVAVRPSGQRISLVRDRDPALQAEAAADLVGDRVRRGSPEIMSPTVRGAPLTLSVTGANTPGSGLAGLGDRERRREPWLGDPDRALCDGGAGRIRERVQAQELHGARPCSDR